MDNIRGLVGARFVGDLGKVDDQFRCRLLYKSGEWKSKEVDNRVFINNGDEGVFTTIGNLGI